MVMMSPIHGILASVGDLETYVTQVSTVSGCMLCTLKRSACSPLFLVLIAIIRAVDTPTKITSIGSR